MPQTSLRPTFQMGAGAAAGGGRRRGLWLGSPVDKAGQQRNDYLGMMELPKAISGLHCWMQRKQMPDGQNAA